MGYMHIASLYRLPEFFELFPEVYAMEKIHGTSTWLRFEHGSLYRHSGGEESFAFSSLFDRDFLVGELTKLSTENNWSLIKVHGEAYGGKQQGMKETYGSKLKFIVFDICVEDRQGKRFLSVPEAESIAQRLGLEFVHYVKLENKPEIIEAEADKESIQAIRNGMGPGKEREGIVVRPLQECCLPGGKRAIAKHKNANFWEIRSRRPLGERLQVVSNINSIVEDWVTENRFTHVMDRVVREREDKSVTIKDIKVFLDLMVEDVQRESEGEVVWTDALVRAIRQKAAIMFRRGR
ncbi:hypothetical protein BQ9231_00218 [Cedratvirus lausannensis]|uniref:RNA ligase domain-containing protein n=1 Tax=Cedratvirus lausannensis TaxID=2023205 RepID=A0A285PWU8_9VIRU|nr:hypothetical protein BQ9231_00218 [Cedratvirus lausannensis]